jgi:adenylate cyclase
MTEIERKWILKEIPDKVKGQTPIPYERHFLFIGSGIEIRIQKKGEKYEFERKVESNDLTRMGEKFEITQAEFDQLKLCSIASLERESYLIPSNPKISIKVYKGKFSGLIRAEVEFDSEESAKDFTVRKWFGEEITDSPLGKDKKLIRLNAEEFKNLIHKYI